MSNDDLPPWEGPDLIDREALERHIRKEKLREVKKSKRIEKGNYIVMDLTAFAEATDVDDMAGDFKAMKRYNKARKEQNIEDNEKVADESWTKHTEYHWSRDLNGKKLNFWPSRNKFQYEGKIIHGDVHGFIRKREQENNDDRNNVDE